MRTNGDGKPYRSGNGRQNEDSEITTPGWRNSRRIGRTFWAVAGAYWKSEQKWSAAGLLAAVVVAVLLRVLTVVFLNNTSGNFFNSLQNKDQAAFYKNSLFVALTLLVQLAMVVGQTFCSSMLEIRWRRWLTERYIGLWLANQAFYRMRFQGRVDNPDQRISEDVRLLISDTMTLTVGFLNTALTVGAFAGVLYGLSGPIHVSALGLHARLSGYLFWVSVLYWLVGAGLGYAVGNPLIWLTNRQQRLEADFRFALIRVREKAEEIALYEGQGFERVQTGRIFGSVNATSLRVLFRNTKLLAVQTLITDAPSPLSFILCAPRFFAGIIPLGDMMKSANGFGQMSASLSWLVNSYPVFADWHATVDRLAGFQRDLGENGREGSTFDVSFSDDEAIELTDVTARLPDGRPLAAGLSFRLVRGEAVLFKGKSGAGKSTLFRVIAGIWPFGSGSVRTPRGMRSLMLPQQPFVPIGKLRTALWFPGEADPGRDEQARAALTAVDLAHLTSRLDDEGHWEQVLSPGEQQRLAVAQAILSGPDWLFLDEATSALNAEQEEAVYRTLGKLLPHTTIVSIGHRETIGPYHSRTIVLPPDLHARQGM